MNYIKQINAFWEIERERGDFSAHLQSFYFALLYFANKYDKSEFSLYREDIMAQAKLSKTQYYKVRESAKEAGLICYQDGANARTKCVFTVLPVSLLLSQKKDTTGDTNRDASKDTAGDTAKDHTQQTYKPTNLLNLQTYKPQRGEAPVAETENWETEPVPEQQAQEEEKEKGCAQKEKEEASGRTYYQRYKDAWWQFYKDQNAGEEPPFSLRHPGLWNGLKKIQQDLAAVFEDCEERAYQEFVYILQSWPGLRDYHRLQVLPHQIHKNLVEIRKFLRESPKNVATIPFLNQAIDLYKQVFHELKGYPPNINGKGPEHVAGTLTYLKGYQENSTWETAFKGFELILRAWPELEKQDKFYSENFTLSYINGNTSKIIGIIKSKGQKHAELTVDAAEAWLARNGFNA